MKSKAQMERWIADTQMFQQIANVQETSKEQLEKEWLCFNNKQKNFHATNAETIRIISEEAKRSAE